MNDQLHNRIKTHSFCFSAIAGGRLRHFSVTNQQSWSNTQKIPSLSVKRQWKKQGLFLILQITVRSCLSTSSLRLFNKQCLYPTLRHLYLQETLFVHFSALRDESRHRCLPVAQQQQSVMLLPNRERTHCLLHHRLLLDLFIGYRWW